MRIAPVIILAWLSFWPSHSYADIFRYETENGEIILTTQPRKEKGLKLIEVIRDSGSSVPEKTRQVATAKHESNTGVAVAATAQRSIAVPGQAAKSKEHAFDGYIREAAELYGIPEAFIRAVIKVESNYNPNAVSRVGAMGLMQLMPATAEHMKVTDPFDPRQNILGGTRYLRRLSDKYDGDINLVLSGYNAGPGNVAKVGGIPFEKTQKYVRDVYYWYKKYRSEE